MVVELPSSRFRTPSLSVSPPVTGHLRESPWTEYSPSEDTELGAVEMNGREEEQEEKKRGAKSAFGQFREVERRKTDKGSKRVKMPASKHPRVSPSTEDNKKEGLDWDAATV